MYKSQKCHNALQWGKMFPEGVLLIFIQILIYLLIEEMFEISILKFRESPKVINTTIFTPPCLLESYSNNSA